MRGKRAVEVKIYGPMNICPVLPYFALATESQTKSSKFSTALDQKAGYITDLHTLELGAGCIAY